jgi:predicted histidine transporter YuiF (NhaC family)
MKIAEAVLGIVAVAIVLLILQDRWRKRHGMVTAEQVAEEHARTRHRLVGYFAVMFAAVFLIVAVREHSLMAGALVPLMILVAWLAMRVRK